jgi:FKBP-type peptidyl-prolyl cis-trans isomerase 2
MNMEKTQETKNTEKFLKISFTGRIKDGPVFDTTDAETAKKEHMHEEKRVYKPLPVILGHHQIIAGLEDAVSAMNVGEEKEVEVSPEKAYGHRKPDLIRLIPLKAFRDQKINPVPGMRLDLDGRPAKIQTIAGGRVRVDFNSDLAGKTLSYKVKVEGEAKKIEEKVEYLVERSFNTADDFAVKISGTNIEVILPETAFRDRNILVRKASLVSEIFGYTSLESVTYVENWTKAKEKETKKEAAKE